MNATLEFKLPEEQQDLARCLAAGELTGALWDIQQHLRSKLKHGELTEEARAELEAVRDLMPYELMERL